MLISIHILNLLIALIDMKEGWSLPDKANVKSLPSIPPAAHVVMQYMLLCARTYNALKHEHAGAGEYVQEKQRKPK